MKDLSAQEFIEAFAQYLKKNNLIERPAWVDFVKTSTSTPSLMQETNSLPLTRTGFITELLLLPERSTLDLTPVFVFFPICMEDSREDNADLKDMNTLELKSSDGVSNSSRSKN